jgi:protein TonB
MRRFALISLGVHAALLAGLLVWFSHRPRLKDAPDSQGAVELVMLEQQGTGTTTAPPQPVPDVAAAPPEAPMPPPAPTESTDAELPLPPPPPPLAAPTPQPAQPNTPPLPPVPPVQHAVQAPEINLGGIDSETNAIVTGDNVIPASVDAKFHNKEPVYPLEAVRRAQQGAVILLVHVSADGLASGVDVARGSGFTLLDRAARDAVEDWHFLPAVKDGEPIPFDMKLRVVFHLE